MDVFDFDMASGEVANRRVAFELPRELGLPDGMSRDPFGRLWVAFWGGSRVVAFDPDSGQPVAMVQVPTRLTSSCCLGPDGQTLYITTARNTLSADVLREEPLAGSVFRAAFARLSQLQGNGQQEPSMTVKPYLRLICLIAAVDSSIYGYDTAVISGTVQALRAHFQLSSLDIGWVVGSALLGCIAGVLLVGRLTDWLGRWRMFLVSALLFVISALWCYFANSVGDLVLARMVGGLGVGFGSLLVPIYIAEISPPKIRGALVSLHQLGIVTGMTLAYVVNAWIGRGGNEVWLAEHGWRLMLAACGIPAIVFLALMSWIPESPRWLIKRGRDDEALRVLRRLHDESTALAEAREIRAAVGQEQGKIRELFRPGVRNVMFMAMTLALFQAITGINVIMYYAPSIYASVGVGTSSALAQQVINGLALIAGTVSSMFVVDRLGRRPIMLMAITAMGLSLALVGVFFGNAGSAGLG